MRIISGINKGCKLDGYDTLGVRPTMDSVKESVFAIIQNKINGSTCLDLFSGTGSIGLELISNGASEVYFNDSSKLSINVINKNINKTRNNDKSIVINKDYKDFIKNINIKFDIIYLDPPYGVIKICDIIDYILKYDILSVDGLIICEYENEIFKDYDNLELIKEKKYGSKYIKIFKRLK